MKEYYGKNWEALLKANDLAGFDALWNLDAAWFEEPNERRGGWSGVSKVKMKRPEGGKVGVFLKRQENHITKSWLHPIRGIPTFQREYNNLMSFIRHGLPTAEFVYYGTRMHEGNLQAILVTRHLKGYKSLNRKRFRHNGKLTGERGAILTSLGKVLSKMHRHHLQHNCLYPKHVFVKKVDGVWDVRIIDLEKLRWRFFKRRAVFRDLGTLYRCERNFKLGLANRLAFVKAYVGEKKLSNASKKIWRTVDANFKTKKRPARL